MENFKHLFVSVEERLPEIHKHVLVIEKGAGRNEGNTAIHYSFRRTETQILAMREGYYDKNGFNTVHSGQITHCLDLSILTTKERAVKLAQDAFEAGRYQSSIKYDDIEDFINQNKDSL